MFKAPAFDPGLNRFPEINVDKIASRLRLEQRGSEDGKKEFPSPDANTLSRTEDEAVGEIRTLRTLAINNFESELQAYANRIASAKTDGQKINLMVGDAENNFATIAMHEKNMMVAAADRASGFFQKLERFREDNDLVGPPRDRTNWVLAYAIIAIMALIETCMNGYFFGAQNTMGWLGGTLLAGVISFISVSIALIFSSVARDKNHRKLLTRLRGYLAVVLFGVICLGMSLATAHFRDALGSHDWQTSLILAVKTVRSTPFDLESFESYVVAMFGALVTLITFIKGYGRLDPYPGFNRAWDDAEKAGSVYAEEAGQGQERLTEQFDAARSELELEAQQHRDRLKSAVDALFGQNAMTRGLDAFLQTCTASATRLLRIYREANLRGRSEPQPAYFDEPYVFAHYSAPKLEKGVSEKSADVEIANVEKIVKEGVDRLLTARRSYISAFPSLSDVKYGHIASPVSGESVSVFGLTVVADNSSEVA